MKVCIATLVLMLSIPHAGYAQAGKSGLAFLKLGVSARGLAMGDATSATVTGAAATYDNPAGILSPDGEHAAQLMFMHREWIQDTRVEFLGASIPLDAANALGFSLNSTAVSKIDIYTRPGPSEGQFTARNLSLGASYAHSFSDDLKIGLTGKFLYQKILVDESSGFGLDLGAQYNTSVENLSIGAVLANVGSMKGLRSETTTLPSLFKIGPGYSIPIEGKNSILSGAFDFVYIFPEKETYLNAGTEFMFNRTVAARLGYQFGSEGRGLAAGLGVSYSIFVLDYAYTRLSSNLGNTHAISLALNF